MNTELPVGFDFSWDFLAFHSIWYSKTKDRQPSLVLLCFDLAGGEEPGRERSGQGTLLGEYKQHIADSVTNKALQDPFEIHALMLRQLLRIIDKTVWNFRKPLKALEEVSNMSRFDLSPDFSVRRRYDQKTKRLVSQRSPGRRRLQ